MHFPLNPSSDDFLPTLLGHARKDVLDDPPIENALRLASEGRSGHAEMVLPACTHQVWPARNEARLVGDRGYGLGHIVPV